MRLRHTALTLVLLMFCTAIAAVALRPTATARERGQGMSLEAAVPTRFAEWTELPDQSGQVVDPLTKSTLDKIYSQVLTRTYVNAQGYRIMLSMAYGDDQRGGLEAHRPEVCYPAQGFTVGTMADATLATTFGGIEVRRLTTSLGERHEPVTYWVTVGNQIIKNKFEKRVAEIKLGLTGQVPDGMLFRVSSIDVDTARGFAMQQAFVVGLLNAVPASTRFRLSGLPAPDGT